LDPTDTLFQMTGIGASGRSDISSNKLKYLADAYIAKEQ
jgi:hypothetical protein